MTSLNLGNNFDTSNVTNMYEMFTNAGHTSMTSLNLGNKFVIPDNANITRLFHVCGSDGILIQVLANEETKNKLMSLSSSYVPQFWKNNNIIQVLDN